MNQTLIRRISKITLISERILTFVQCCFSLNDNVHEKSREKVEENENFAHISKDGTKVKIPSEINQLKGLAFLIEVSQHRHYLL